MLSNIRAHGLQAARGACGLRPRPPRRASLDRRKLLLERLDVALVHRKRLLEPRDALAVLLGVVALLGQRARRAVGVEGARLGEAPLLGGKLVREHLAADVVASLLRIGIDARKARRRR